MSLSLMTNRFVQIWILNVTVEPLFIFHLQKVLIGDKASLAVAEALGQKSYSVIRPIITDLKAIKNATELEGFRQCHIRDGVALARYFSWLEEQLTNGVVLNESQGADQLEKFRSWVATTILRSVIITLLRFRELGLFKGLSFPTISSTGPNGAIIHYSPDPNDCDVIKKDQVISKHVKITSADHAFRYTFVIQEVSFSPIPNAVRHIFINILVAAQFLDGTTDVTRTWVSNSYLTVRPGLIFYSILEHQQMKKNGRLHGYFKAIFP